MRLLLLTILFLSFNSFAAQRICLLESEIDKVMAKVPGSGRFNCDIKKDENCICRPMGKGWHELKKGPGMKQVPRFSKTQIEVCSGRIDCNLKTSEKVCDDLEAIAYVDIDFTESYCAKLTHHEDVPTGLTVLVDDPVKKAAFIQARLDAKAAKKAQRDEIKAIRGRLKDDLSISDDVKELLKELSKNR